MESAAWQAGTGRVRTVAVAALGCALSLALLGAGTAYACPAPNPAIDLGTLSSDDAGALATAINSRGQIVGWSASVNPDTFEVTRRPFLWRPERPRASTGVMTHLAGLPDGTEPSAINKHGQVVGTYRDPQNSLLRAVLWTPDAPNSTTGTTTELGAFVGFGNSQALAMNDSGQIVGASTVADFEDHAFLWTPDRPNGTTGEMVDLGVLPAGISSTASGINDKGVVVGSSFFADADGVGRWHAFRWTPKTPNATTGAMRDLGVLRGDAWSFATGINRRGDIVGYDYSSLVAEEIMIRPFMSRGATLVPFARMPAALDQFTSDGRVPGQFRPTAVSDRGAVVGWTRDVNGDINVDALWPVLWTPTMPNGTTGAFLRLPDAINAKALALNDHGQVVGGDINRALLWTLAPHGLNVAIDIKPGDASNVINPGGRGTLPVAILSSRRFDATTVDPLTVTLANAVVPLRPDGEPLASVKDVNRDGRPDLLIHVSKDALSLPRSSKRAELCGETLNPGANGTVIEGTDRVRVIG